MPTAFADLMQEAGYPAMLDQFGGDTVQRYPLGDAGAAVTITNPLWIETEPELDLEHGKTIIRRGTLSVPDTETIDNKDWFTINGDLFSIETLTGKQNGRIVMYLHQAEEQFRRPTA